MAKLYYIIAALGGVAALLNALNGNVHMTIVWWLAAGIWALNADLAAQEPK